jgi:uncharacterized protein involved in response to NO
MNFSITAIFSCGFRPFFLLASSYVVLLMGAWLFFWQGWLTLPASLGGPIPWHIYELVYGFALAGVIGFLSTAMTEFIEGSKQVNRGPLLVLVLLWLAGRVSFWLSGEWGTIPAAVFNLALLANLLILLTPPIWNAPGRPHMSFVYVLLILGAIETGFYIGGFRGMAVMPWLYAAIGTLMILIVIALSRISMRIINGLEEGVNLFDEDVEYLARPPRRNMAMFTIALFTALEFFAPGDSITGWLALAASAAMLNLFNLSGFYSPPLGAKRR